VLQSQMQKLGAKLKVEKRGDFETMTFDGKASFKPKASIEFNCFSDHRIIMSLVPLSAMGLKISVDDPKVVSRSYPCFWEDVKKSGFIVE